MHFGVNCDHLPVCGIPYFPPSTTAYSTSFTGTGENTGVSTGGNTGGIYISHQYYYELLCQPYISKYLLVCFFLFAAGTDGTISSATIVPRVWILVGLSVFITLLLK